MIVEGCRPDVGAYRRFVMAFSGGKDSLAAPLHLLNLGVLAQIRSLDDPFVRKPTVRTIG